VAQNNRVKHRQTTCSGGAETRATKRDRASALDDERNPVPGRSIHEGDPVPA